MTDTILPIFEIIALAALSVVCIYLVAFLIRLRSIMSVIAEDVKEVSSKAVPVLENLEVITERVKHVAESVDEQVDAVKDSINSMKAIADSIVSFERKVQERIEEPVIETVGTLAAVIKGVRMFVARLRA